MARDLPTPDLGTYLIRLAGTVKSTLAPRAENDFLREQLYSLSSILKILGSEAGQLPADQDDDVVDLGRALQALGVDFGTTATPAELRRALAARSREHPVLGTYAQAVLADYLDRDLARPFLGLLEPARADPVALPAEARGETGPDAKSRVAELLAAVSADGGEPHEVRFDAEASSGYSAETMVGTIEAPAGPVRFAARVQWTERPLGRLVTSLEQHRAALALLERRGVPVPRVLLATDESATLGAYVLVSEFVDGLVPTPWTPSGKEFMQRLRDGNRDTILTDLAMVQGIDWASDPAGAVLLEAEKPLDHVRGRLDRWFALYREFELRADPLVEEVIGFLQTELRQWSDLVLVHGDYRPGNIIYDPATTERRAIIDWDGVHLGDVHEDLGQMLAWPYRVDGLACGLYTDEELVAAYEHASDRRVDPAALHFYVLLATFRRYLGFCLLARSWLDTGGDVRMARAWLALRNDRIELGRLLRSGPTI